MKTHSEIKDFLSKVGIKANLTPPPRESIAVLSDSVSAFACSARFRSPFSGCGILNSDSVLTYLVSQYTGKQVSWAELCHECLDAWVERSLVGSNSHSSVNGRSIRYLLDDSSRKTRQNGSPDWLYLPDSLSLTVLPSTPFVIDDCPVTLRMNLQELKDALSEERDSALASLASIQQKLDKINAALSAVSAD